MIDQLTMAAFCQEYDTMKSPILPNLEYHP